LLRAALINIGSVLTAKSTVETEPASTATLVMQEKLRAQALAHVGSDTHLRQRVRWGISRTTSAADPTSHQLRGVCSLCRCCKERVIDAKLRAYAIWDRVERYGKVAG
jgi:hypothetical protein